MTDFVGRLRTPRLSAAPASPAVGEVYYDTSTNALYYWNGTIWVQASGWQLINSLVVSGTAVSFNPSSISAAFRQLVVVWSGRSDQAVDASGATIQLNGDTGANYNYEQLDASGATVSSSHNAAVTNISAGGVPGGNTNASVMAAGEIWIPHYANTTRFKSVHCFAGFAGGAAGTPGFVRQTVGLWSSTAAITSLLLRNPGNWTDGSRFALYGIL